MNAADASGDCLVCLNPCTTFSYELFLYNCDCVYRVHPPCFRQWRLVADSDRICVICQEALDPFSESGEQEQPQPEPQQQQPQQQPQGIDQHIDNCLKNICALSAYTLVIVYLSVFLYAIKPS